MSILRVSLYCCVLATLLTAARVEPARSQEAQASEAILLVLNRAKVLQLPPNAVTIIVGNPAIADVTMVRRSKHMVLTGKGFGETNLIALDAQGRSVGESTIRVSAPTRNLIVQRGLERETWDCTPRCQPTFSLGDGGKFSSETAAQMQARNAAIGTSQRPAGGF